MNKSIRLITFFLIITLLFSQFTPIFAVDTLLNSRFNLNYKGERGYQIMPLSYENASIETSFKGLADRAIALKTASNYSSSKALQVLSETKSVVNKITVRDYLKYEDMFLNNVNNGGNYSIMFTYDSFIMRNVLYAMIKNNASYTDLLKAIQIIYDTAISQTKKDAFRSDALEVLKDLNILADYTSNSDISNMLFYVSRTASGVHGSYNGSKTIPSMNIASSYNQYLKEQKDKGTYNGEVEHNENRHESEFTPGGSSGIDEIMPTPEQKNPITSDENFPSDSNNDKFISDSFMEDLDSVYEGTINYKYTLYYTLDKSNPNATYNKTRVTIKSFATYQDILDALLFISKNSEVKLIEDSEAFMTITEGKSYVMIKSDELYDAASIEDLFDCYKDFGLFLMSET